MILKHWLQEFEQEASNTRKLLQSVPQKDLSYRPADISWTMGELAQHIATIYYWYVGTLTQDTYDIAADHLERGSPNNIRETLTLFENNVEKARETLTSLKEEQLSDEWTMKAGNKVLMGPMPRAIVARNFLFNHLYHHRGEMIVYLRATGNKVPGLYGPTYEDGQNA